MTLQTPRLTLIPATAALAHAELYDQDAFAAALHADIPENWPPETLADALPWFLSQLTANPELSGWLGWYALLAQDEPCPVLVGSIGFFGPPQDGEAEIGYSVLSQYQGQGHATEMVNSLTAWAFTHPDVRRVVAQTVPDNLASQRVLAKAGFVPTGAGREAGHVQFGRDAPAP